MRKVFILAALLVSLSVPAAANNVTLHASVMVSGPYVLLGDLFEYNGPKRDARVAYAPAPGKRTVYDANWLFSVARTHGLDWRPLNLRTRAIVERQSQVIYHDEIEEVLQRALKDQGLDGEAEVVFSNRSLKMHLPAEKEATMEVQALNFDRVSGRFVATVAAPAGDPSAHRLRVSGRAYRLVKVPTLTRAIRNGDVISKHDVEMINVRERRLRDDTIFDADQLIGLEAKRSIRPGIPVSDAMIRPPQLVKRGSMVTVILQINNMRLTSQAKAIQAGSLGDFVRVRNAQSGIIVDAEIIGHNRVRVQKAERVAQN